MNEADVRAWVENGPSLELIQKADNLGEKLAQGKESEKLTTSQIRQVFTKLKAIEAKGYTEQRLDFMMLKPFLAYAQGREKSKPGVRLFKETMTWGIEAVLQGRAAEENQRFLHFCKLFEAVLAYHKYHETKKGDNK